MQICAEGTGTQVQRPQRSQGGAAVATVGVQVLVRNRQIVAVARASLTTDLSYTQLNIKPGPRLIRGLLSRTVGLSQSPITMSLTKE